RRRHTRSYGDWSSDVCSSDLDWNHPSIILWGVRINESKDDHDFYTKTNAMAHSLDPTRQTGGIRYFQESEFLEDVFTMNDFGFRSEERRVGKECEGRWWGEPS